MTLFSFKPNEVVSGKSSQSKWQNLRFERLAPPTRVKEQRMGNGSQSTPKTARQQRA